MGTVKISIRKVLEIFLIEFLMVLNQRPWSCARRVCICAPNTTTRKENLDFSHPIFGFYFVYFVPNIRLLLPPLYLILFRGRCMVFTGRVHNVVLSLFYIKIISLTFILRYG